MTLEQIIVAYLIAHAPDRISTKRLDSTVGGVDRMKLNAIIEEQVRIDRVDMDAVANGTEDTSCDLDGLGHDREIVCAKLPRSITRIGLNHDGELDLTLEFIELGSILRLGKSELVSRNVADSEIVLLKNVLGFGSVVEIVKAKMNTTGVDRNTVSKASILVDVRQSAMRGRTGSLTSFI